MRQKFIVIITTEGEGPGWPTPQDVMLAIEAGVNEQNPGVVTMTVQEVEGE